MTITAEQRACWKDSAIFGHCALSQPEIVELLEEFEKEAKRGALAVAVVAGLQLERDTLKAERDILKATADRLGNDLAECKRVIRCALGIGEGRQP